MEFMRNRKEPCFMHIHLMSSHYGEYKGARHWFKKSEFPEIKNGSYEHMRYMDAIRDFDEHLRTFVSWLEKEGRLSNTILIISSDHTQRWGTTERIPLIIYFPDEDNKGRVKRNVSLVDVAPSILNYMGIKDPDWMSGRSAVKNDRFLQANNSKMTLEGNEPILSLEEFRYTRHRIKNGVLSSMDKPGPPLYGVSQVALILCNQWRKISLETGKVTAGKVSGHTSPCLNAEFPSNDEVREYIAHELSADGFSLPAWAATPRNGNDRH
jgi:membrane-anchored protein YejM (alkaline phosphatase superfamily)